MLALVPDNALEAGDQIVALTFGKPGNANTGTWPKL